MFSDAIEAASTVLVDSTGDDADTFVCDTGSAAKNDLYIGAFRRSNYMPVFWHQRERIERGEIQYCWA